MYATCIFCNSSLGANESIEHFPVGRRLAYDGATGRLWVVCPKCARWNLSPLEERWEAIEEAERAFRSTKLRVSTDNIGLAQLKEGTELVRIGKPLQTEYAAWRYGDQFAKRQRAVMLPLIGPLAIGGAGLACVTAAVSHTGQAGTVGLTALSAATVLNLSGTIVNSFASWRSSQKIRAGVRDREGNLLHLTRIDALQSLIVLTDRMFDWRLRVPRHTVEKTNVVSQVLGVKERTRYTGNFATLRDEAALRALSMILPQANYAGAGKKRVREAVGLIEEAPSIHYLLHLAGSNKKNQRYAAYENDGGSTLVGLPPSLRLALEMSLHTDDERRAMEGELAELEQRWRDADAIAKIADELLLPETVQTRLDSQKLGKADP
ncbi:MAG: hypothetical protein ABI852_00580 [Gemmatimonadaceae bacterium]